MGGSGDHGGYQRRGHVDRSHVPGGLKQHELDAAQRLADRGHAVVFIPSSGRGTSADMTIDGQLWQLKSISGASNDSVARNLRRAAKQCVRVVVDVTACSLADELVKTLVKHYTARYGLQSVRVIRGSWGMDWRFDDAKH